MKLTYFFIIVKYYIDKFYKVCYNVDIELMLVAQSTLNLYTTIIGGMTMKYKQYLWFKDGESKVKPISCFKVKEEDSDEFEEFVDSPIGYFRDDFGYMNVSFIDEHKDEAEGCWGFQDDDLLVDQVFYANNYAQSILGKFPGWIPTLVEINCDQIRFRVDHMVGECGCMNSLLIHVCSFPLGAKIKIEVESRANFDPDTYIVMNKGADSIHMALFIEEYRDSMLLRTCEFGRDEKGDFELITEA